MRQIPKPRRKNWKIRQYRYEKSQIQDLVNLYHPQNSSWRPPGGVPNHAITQIFCHFHAFMQSMKNSDFNAKTLKLGKKTCLPRNHARFWMISRNHAHFSTLSVSRMQVDSRIHAEMKSFSRIRSITQSRNPMGGPLQSQSVEKKYQGDGSNKHKEPPSHINVWNRRIWRIAFLLKLNLN